MTELSRKGSLPYGWQVKTSRRYPDRIYYFNIITGSSTWECPELDPPREIAVEDKKLSSVNKIESGNENTQLPKGFLKKKCPSESSYVSEDSKDVDDIEMLDVSMDIIDDLTAKKETVFDTFASYYIVVDTNVLISELSLINEIKDTPLDGCGPPHIFIPWIVIEELDRLKNQRSLKANCIRAAGEAIRYLNSVLGKHPRFHGQSPAEAEQWAKTYSKCNDDKILECCVALADKMPREKVILLTNDKNLVNKALICNVIVHDSSSLMKYVKPDVVFTYSKPKDKKSKKGSENGTSGSASPSEASKISQSPTVSPVDKNLITKRDAYKREIHSIMSKARQLLKDALAKFFYEEMEEAYGEIWLSFPIKKDLLEGILEGIKKYWTVFSDFMTAKDKRNFELLKEKVSRPAGFWGDKEDCLVILSTMEEIFTQVQKRKPSINVPVSIIQDFRVACVEFFHKYCDVDSAIQTVEQESTLALFERNWAAINQLSGIILDFCKLPHDFQYDKPDALPSESDIRRLICNLYPAVQHLKVHMFKMLDAVRNCKPLSKIIRTLAAALLNFFPSLEIPHEQVSFPSFSQAALEMFCSRPQNREMIEIGCKQIEKFYSKLDDALSSIMSAKFKKTCASPETMICD